MKHLFIFILILSSHYVVAQTSTSPKWTPEEGYWVAETNTKDKHKATLFFYTNENQLIYKEEVAHRKFNLNKRRTLMHLKSVLQIAITLHNGGKKIIDTTLLAYRISR